MAYTTPVRMAVSPATLPMLTMLDDPLALSRLWKSYKQEVGDGVANQKCSNAMIASNPAKVENRIEIGRHDLVDLVLRVFQRGLANLKMQNQ